MTGRRATSDADLPSRLPGVARMSAPEPGDAGRARTPGRRRLGADAGRSSTHAQLAGRFLDNGPLPAHGAVFITMK